MKLLLVWKEDSRPERIGDTLCLHYNKEFWKDYIYKGIHEGFRNVDWFQKTNLSSVGILLCNRFCDLGCIGDPEDETPYN